MNAQFRKPVNLPQIDDNSCYTNVVAQTRWMLGISDRNGADAVHEVDRLTGRRAGHPADVQSQILLLTRDGCKIVSLEQEVDVERLRADGVAYLKSLAGGTWPSCAGVWWTPDRVEDYARQTEECQRRFRQEFAPHLASGQLRVVHGWPRLRYVDRLIAAGYVVLATIDTGSASTSHAVLVYDRRGSTYEVYRPHPSPDVPMVQTWRRSDLAEVLIPDNGFIAVKHPLAALAVAA